MRDSENGSEPDWELPEIGESHPNPLKNQSFPDVSRFLLGEFGQVCPALVGWVVLNSLLVMEATRDRSLPRVSLATSRVVSCVDHQPAVPRLAPLRGAVEEAVSSVESRT